MVPQCRAPIDIVKQVRNFFENNAVKNAVNMASLSQEDLKEIKPFIELAEKIGIIQSQLVSRKGGIKEVTLRYAGNISSSKVSPITVAFLKGLLEFVAEDVNFINASVIAAERGIKITESKMSKLEDFVNLITIKIKTSKEETIVAINGSEITENDIRSR